MKKLILPFVLLLTACAPVNYVYVRKDVSAAKKINQVLVVIEYLDIKQGISDVWKFDENTNLFHQDQLFDIAEKVLQQKGYQLADMSLKTSGLIIDRNFIVRHYYNKKVQEQLISPPYIVRSVNLDDQNIQALEGLLAELNQPISPVMSDLKGYIVNNYEPQTSAINIPDDTAILIIQSYKSRVSLFSNFEFDIGINSFSSGTTAALGYGGNQQSSTTYSYLIHKGSGDLLWSNKTNLINDKNQEKFFSLLPKKL